MAKRIKARDRVKRTSKKMKELGKGKRDFYSKQKDSKYLFFPKQSYLRFFRESTNKVLYFLSSPAKIKYFYLSENQAFNLLNNTYSEEILRKANEKVFDGYIKHKKKFFGKVKNYKEIMESQLLFRKFLTKAYGMSYPSHPWNIVDKSPWPFVSGFSSWFFVLGLVALMYGYGIIQLDLGFISILMSFILWNKDIVREGTFQGKHTSFVKNSLKTGFKYFIVSEFMLFFSFFWSFYNFYLNGSLETAYSYPPIGIWMDDKLPGIMNIILIMSGCIITFSHIHFHLKLNLLHTYSYQVYLALTIMLGTIFICFQIYEYCHNSFSFSDSTFGSVFYILTGCHSLHVIIGVTFLFTSFVRNFRYHTTLHSNLNYILSIWYWHFVDIVWIFLYLKIYYLFHSINKKQFWNFHYTMYDFTGGSMYFDSFFYYDEVFRKIIKNLDFSKVF